MNNSNAAKLLQAIFKAQSGRDDEGLTLFELAQACGLSGATVRERLKAAQAMGLIEIEQGRKQDKGIDGVLRPVPCYRIKKLEKK